MSEGSVTAAAELDGILRRLDEARDTFVKALNESASAPFETVTGEHSLKSLLDRTADDLNFYYGRLAARALNLPQPPCLTRADFGSLREGTVAVQVAHRRFSNLLHDLVPADLDKTANDAELGSHTLRQVLELATAHYKLRTQQVQAIAQSGDAARPRE
jgi:hypothetical protein